MRNLLALVFKVKDDVVRELHSICQKIWKTQQWPQYWRRSVFILIPKKGSVKDYVQPIIQLHSFQILARLCSKSFKLGFSTAWTKKFQMYKLDWKRQRNQRSNCQQSLDPEKAKFQEKNIYFCFFDYAKAFECMDHKKTVENSKMDENTRPPYLSPQKLVCRTRSNS